MNQPLSVLPLNLGLMAASPQAGAQEGGYRLPPAALQAIVDAARAPALSLSPQRDIVAVIETPPLPGIAEVAQPELKLAGLRINPRTCSASRFSFGADLSLLEVATRKERRITGLPRGLRLSDVSWSPDQRHLAFTHVALKGERGSVELWVVDVAERKARKLSPQPLSAVLTRGFNWLPDSSGLLVHWRPAGIGKAPVSSGIPSGPIAQDSTSDGHVRQLRTYQDLLKSEDDARLFEYYITVQMAIIDLHGKTRLVGAPGQFSRTSIAPGGEYLLTQSVTRPYSYIVPASSFGERVEVRDLHGVVVHTVANLPLEEGLPQGNDAVSDGVRHVSWRADAPASLVWAEAQDGGDPAREVVDGIRDLVMLQAAPFRQPPLVLARLTMRYAGIAWGRDDVALINERWHKTRAYKQWMIEPGHLSTPPELIHTGSYEDRYNSPGSPVMRADVNGFPRLLIGPGTTVLMDGAGATPDGDRPFIDRVSLTTKKKERLFQSAAPYFENVAAVLNDDGTLLLTTRESPTERPNYYLRDLTRPEGEQLTALTNYPHPTPQLKDVAKQQIRYTREDGVELTATLMLPPDYDAARDGPLPLLMWAYPQEFKSAGAASQTTGSPYRFNSVSYWGPAAFLAMGYAVLDNPSFPIVGVGDEEPNDTYLPQLVASAEAAVEEVVRCGVADRHRIAIGGHSYGAFMTGNLLAHTRLFRAGIARSGAYNRTLTPFGFQSEERPYWQAAQVYQAMSPFNNADKIKDAMLLIHGAEDSNSGTFPLQSERMFQAIKGLGGTARLVMLPNESHAYRARESIMHMLYETNAWLEKYVKHATA
ncbi:prolyl oligopeptidase family serine peptidase [Pseudoduganella sp. FT25W]|uniref:Prolyl oligopeptidase family serine peptidase n=1 Tax=Duganella alba TaxID=2666081 RepID=A0A6L5QM97_9BURK|nr:prolyl oligopeptidase family serine peptidase [Duganella alba]MRX10916.1 prolyl oligopeptidase family serine peptidase [Duganella alba]MRX19039.1 prolyl oligopeptidase family serine peptidase [Duganella alba]